MALPVIAVLTLIPFSNNEPLDKDVLTVELPTLSSEVVRFTFVPILTVDVLTTTFPTVAVVDKNMVVAFTAAAFTVVLLAVNAPFTTRPFFTTKFALFDTVVPFPQSLCYLYLYCY